MRIMTRMVIREFIPNFFVSMGILIFVLIVNRIFELMNLFIGKGVNVLIVGELFLNTLPFIIFLTIPMSVLVAAIMTFGRMSNDFEMTALNALGFSGGRIIRNLLIFSVFLFILAALFGDMIVPDSNHRVKMLISGIMRMKPSVSIEDGIIKSSYDGKTKFYFEHIDNDGAFINARIMEKDRTISAPEGMLMGEHKGRSYVNMRKGFIVSADGNDRRTITFGSMITGIAVAEDVKKSYVGRGDREMTTAMLLERIRNVQENAAADDNAYERERTKRNIYRYLVEIYKKFSIAFGVFGFILLGSVIGVAVRKSGLGVGFAISTLLFVIYYIMIVIGEQLSDKGLIHPLITMWFPNAVSLILGAVLFYRVIYCRPMPLMEKLQSMMRRKTQ